MVHVPLLLVYLRKEPAGVSKKLGFDDQDTRNLGLDDIHASPLSPVLLDSPNYHACLPYSI